MQDLLFCVLRRAWPCQRQAQRVSAYVTTLVCKNIPAAKAGLIRRRRQNNCTSTTTQESNSPVAWRYFFSASRVGRRGRSDAGRPLPDTRTSFLGEGIGSGDHFGH